MLAVRDHLDQQRPVHQGGISIRADAAQEGELALPQERHEGLLRERRDQFRERGRSLFHRNANPEPKYILFSIHIAERGSIATLYCLAAYQPENAVILDAFAVHAGVDAAFILVEASPAAVPIGLTGRHPAGARDAADGGVTVLHQGVTRKTMLFLVGIEIGQCPFGQGIEAEAALEKFDRIHRGASSGLEFLAAGDLRGETLQRTAQGNHLAEIATRVRAF